ncbi:hypothetical protein CSH63_11600 [Micromonospora tulbaghiae]|uniref:Uncharacterized protein n=1 Tax=Micromonospora tulbaghiae TaxID=479978 RepID=A0A386WKC1_9ACTN|nr:hypothetical protein [Micromonospora tulbaghiae]AYF28078.1 hypothetical protein CSH63_11600 [Micromonospora tulbaghiae]
MTERVTADRLLLVNVVHHWFYLRQPTFIGTGQTYWIDHGTSELCVDRGDDRVTRHPRVTRHADWMSR